MLDNKIDIEKDAKSAYEINFDVPDGTKVLLGHTRKSTQGSEKRNFNNHPFIGKTDKASFALAHNGIISNDKILRSSLKLAKSKVETDSYIAVQLLEHEGELNMESIKFMAESVVGSFSFTILDDQNNLYIVKGDSPISILHFKEMKLYVYASTDKILWKALVNSPFFENLKSGVCSSQSIEEIKLSSGQILKLSGEGKLEYGNFKYSDTCDLEFDWSRYGTKKNVSAQNDEYLEDLKQIAVQIGYSEDMVDELVQEGFSLMEIEDYLYDPELFQSEFNLMQENEI